MTNTVATDTTTTSTTTIIAGVSTVPIPEGFQYPSPTPGAPQKRAIDQRLARGGALIIGRTAPTAKPPHCSGSSQKYPSKVTCYELVETFIPTSITKTAKTTTTQFAPHNDDHSDCYRDRHHNNKHVSSFPLTIPLSNITKVSPSASLKQRPTPHPQPAQSMPPAPPPPTKSAATTRAVPSNSWIRATLPLRTSTRTTHTTAAWRVSRRPIASARTMAPGSGPSAASWKWVPPAPHHRAGLVETIAMEGTRRSL